MQNKHKTMVRLVLAALLVALACGFALAEAPECPSPDSPDGAHNYIPTIEPATCLTGATVVETCSYCGATLRSTMGPPDPDAHDFTSTEIPPTCGEPGHLREKCSICGFGQNVPGYEELHPATGNHTWNDGEITTPPTYDAEGVKTYKCTVCGETKTETVPKLTPTEKPTPNTTTPRPETPTPAPANPTKKPSNNNSNNAAPAAPAATEAPALPYGSIVSDIERADEPYVPETVADDTGANTILVITADPDEDGTYTLRNLHITDELLAQLNTEGILTVRFVVGDATVEFPVASFTGDAVTTIKGDLDADVTAFLVTIDPNATTADGAAGVSVGSSVITTDAVEYDVTPLIPDLSLTIGDTPAQPVTTATVYTAQHAAEAAPAEPAVEEAPAEEAPAEPAVEEAPAKPAVEEPAADEAVAA